MAENKVELKRLVGEFVESSTGKRRRAGWDMDQLILNGRQIATINHVPGAAVGLFAGVQLTPSEEEAVAKAVAAERGNVRPAKIGGVDPRLASAMQLLDDEPEDDDEGDDE